jgi:NADH:ubiquinone oxidoreductase subunit F (NADH-binding)
MTGGPAGTARLMAGWQESSRAAALPEHLDRYGPLPLRGGGRSRGGGGHGRRPGLADAVADAGLTGRGGGGFPTGTKLRAVAAHAAAARSGAVVVANGVESEPASSKDEALLSLAQHLVLDGAVLAAEAVGAGEAHLCLSRLKSRLIDQLLAAVAERQRSALDPVPIIVHALPRHYIASEETALIRWLNGGEAKPVLAPPRPHERGVRRLPTLVDNVETLAHIALIARYGPAWFRRAGRPDAPGTMLVTISGDVAYPGVREIELGTAVGDVLARCGAAQGISAVLVGGYFGSWHEAGGIAGTPMGGGELGRLGASPGAGVLVALPAASCGLTETARVLAYLAAQSARQCGPCTFGLASIAEDFARLAAGWPGDGLLERLGRRLGIISGRGACRHPDGAIRLAASALVTFAADVSAHARCQPCAAARRGAREHPVLPIPSPDPDEGWR